MIPLRDDNPTEITPVVTVATIVMCVLVFLYEISLPAQRNEAFVYMYGAIPAVVFGHVQLPPELMSLPAYGTLFSSMFLHGGWMHLIGNMLYLWIFGNNIEDIMTRVRFVVFYVACGIIAALAHAIPNADSTIPMIGASGAISGVLGAYLLVYPRARILVLIPLGFISQLIRMPAIVVLGFWFVLQLISTALSDSSGGGVAWGAHLGGFVAGVVLIPFFKRRDVSLFHKKTGTRD